MLSRFVAVAALAVAGVAAVYADDIAVINLNGVVLQDATNQTRSSSPDTIDAGYVYHFVTTGTARGTSGLLQVLFPNAVPISQILDTLQPGSSAALVGDVYNPTGALPVVVNNQTIDQTSTLLGTTVHLVVTLTAGIDANHFGYFSLTNVQMLPNSGFLRLGALQIVSGTTTITRVPVVFGDMNWDGVLNNFDIDAFVLALLDPAGYETTYGHVPLIPGDCNHDGAFNNFDIDAFVNLLLGA